jgi:hypothetical protein
MVDVVVDAIDDAAWPYVGRPAFPLGCECHVTPPDDVLIDIARCVADRVSDVK